MRHLHLPGFMFFIICILAEKCKFVILFWNDLHILVALFVVSIHFSVALFVVQIHFLVALFGNY